MRRRIEERLDPAVVVPGARTVLVLGIPYDAGVAPAGIARYARGRDYHYAHRDRMRKLRGRLRAIDPSLRTYACVDSGVHARVDSSVHARVDPGVHAANVALLPLLFFVGATHGSNARDWGSLARTAS